MIGKLLLIAHRGRISGHDLAGLLDVLVEDRSLPPTEIETEAGILSAHAQHNSRQIAGSGQSVLGDGLPRKLVQVISGRSENNRVKKFNG